jgi:hypothetical protein
MKKIIVALLFLISFNIAAADFDAKSELFCEKIKSCVLKELAGQDITAAVAAIAKPMIDTICDELKKSITAKSAKVPEDIEPDLDACMDSMRALSCSALMEGKAETAACKSLQKKAEQINKP